MSLFQNVPLIRRFCSVPYFQALGNLSGLLVHDERKQSFRLVVLMVINAVLDLFSLASVVGLLPIILESDISPAAHEADPHILHTFLATIYQWSGLTDERWFLFYWALALLILFIFKSVISAWIAYRQAQFAYHVSWRLNRQLFTHFYQKGYLFIRQADTGRKLYSVVDVPMRFASSYLMPTLAISADLLILIMLLVALLWYDPFAICLLAIAVLPVVWGIYQWTHHRIKTVGDMHNRLMPKNYGLLLRAMKAYVYIKLANCENAMRQQYLDSQRALNHQATLYHGLYTKWHQRSNEVIFMLGILTIVVIGIWTGRHRGELLFLMGIFGVAAFKTLPTINRILGGMLQIKNASFVIDELSVLKGQRMVDFREVQPLDFTTQITIHNLYYQYPESADLALEDINMVIRKGETLGITGPSGGGKSTLLKIIMRLLVETSGNIIVDDQALDTTQLNASFQLNIGYVDQDSVVFEGTIAENVTLYSQDIDSLRVRKVLQQAQLWQWVSELPETMQHRVGESGTKLSGGQKQRLAIARALYKDADIFVFDEATNALDAATQYEVLRSITQLAAMGKTIILVTHQNTTLQYCDRVLQLVDGKLCDVNAPTS